MREQILYRSTRGTDRVTSAQAIVSGIAPDGGLYVPETMPQPIADFAALAKKDYRGIAREVMGLFLTDFTEEEIAACVDAAYDEKFDTPEIAPLAKVGENFFLELYHGQTIAFKDMALSILPHLMTAAAKKCGLTEDILILTATSGDTGKAALAGFADVPGTRIAVFFPQGGVSPVQEAQMVTQTGGNVCVTAVRGNFDDAQTGVKKLFADRALGADLAAQGVRLSSANSINIGRLVPQVVYYVYACARLMAEGELAPGELLNVCVPTGNFGNILAAYYARQIGAPIGKLVCASNRNRVLFDFFRNGTYDRNREFYLTSSPSMDILISSNLERLIFSLVGEDPEADRALMAELSARGAYDISPDMAARLEMFRSGFATEEETSAEISRVWGEYQYLLDPHTAVASAVAEKYRRESGDAAKMLIVSTASPYKFTGTVLPAVQKAEGKEAEAAGDGFAQARALKALTGWEIPAAVTDLEGAPVLHRGVCDIDRMEETVRAFAERG
ncbi:MAG: threonine synthase [Lachnospiraceae bacterium]|nr:threonine synthase [Lachnospiraceae bacterium]